MAKFKKSGWRQYLESTRVLIYLWEWQRSQDAYVSPTALGILLKMLPYIAGRPVDKKLVLSGRYATGVRWQTMRKYWPELSQFFDQLPDGTLRLREADWFTVQTITAERQTLRHLLDRLVAVWGNACVYCGTESGLLEIEHIVPVVRGGSDDITNLTLACKTCNSKKRTKTAAEFGHPHIHEMAARIQ